LNDRAAEDEGTVPSQAQRIRSLNELLSASSLKSSSRVFILILLAMNTRMDAVELRELTRLGKGSLENHLSKLEQAGFITTRKVKFFGGRRQTAEITELGLENCRTLLQAIQSLDGHLGLSKPMKESAKADPLTKDHIRHR
jgi:DNA-binding MarR family transcriptional regulator